MPDSAVHVEGVVKRFRRTTALAGVHVGQQGWVVEDRQGKLAPNRLSSPIGSEMPSPTQL
jgi:hypothetical protein